MDELRIASLPPEKKITLVVNGKTITAFDGQSVHAALLAAGFRAVRKTDKTGEPRGIFCGMGVCYDCLVTINGAPNQRACMTKAEDRMEIRIDA